MGGTYTIMTIFGIPIRINFSWILVFAFFTVILFRNYSVLYEQWNTPQALFMALLSVFLLFVLVLIHELAHSVTAQLHGLKVKEITLFMLGGVSIFDGAARTARGEFLITIAGPLTNVIFFGALLGVQLSGVADGYEPASALIQFGVYVNASLAIFNLLPGLPLDGGRVVSSLVWGLSRKKEKPYIATAVAATMGQILGGLFLFTALLPIIARFTLFPLLDLIGAGAVADFIEAWIPGLSYLTLNIMLSLIGVFLISIATAEKKYQRKLHELREQEKRERENLWNKPS